MAKKYWRLDTFDRSSAFFVLWHYRPEGGIGPRPEYARLTCAECGCTDTLKALRKGISPEVTIPKRPTDLMCSDDNLLVVSPRLKKLLESRPGCNLKYFPLHDGSGYHVIWPSRMFYPAQAKLRPVGGTSISSPAFGSIKDTCPKCHRLKTVTFRSDEFEIPKPWPIVSVYSDRRRLPLLVLMIDDELKQVLRAAKITGWRAHREVKTAEATEQIAANSFSRDSRVRGVSMAAKISASQRTAKKPAKTARESKRKKPGKASLTKSTTRSEREWS